MHDDSYEEAATLSRWEAILESQTRQRYTGDDGSHDPAHARRVWRLARRMAGQLDEPVDFLVLLAGAYLHDAVAIEKDDPRRSEASRLAAEFAGELLGELGFPSDRLDAVAHAIEAHSFSAGVRPLTIEAKLLQDADRMEALGAVGIARTFYVAGRIGSWLFHPDDPLGERRALDDRSYALDHFFIKLLKLPDTMTTNPGKAIAARRAAVIWRYVEDILEEINR